MEGIRKKLSRFEIFTFASGDLFGGGAQIIISFYYLIFLTDVVKLRPALAGTAILISKIWDALNDPIMGIITDNTRSRWGRRKPFFLLGFFGIIIAFSLLWYPVVFENQLLSFAYVLVTYLFYSTIQTMVMIPYAAMSTEISTDYRERTVVNGTRLFLSQIASLLCAVVPIEIVKLFPDGRSGYIIMAFLFSIFFAVPYILIFLFTKERCPVSDEKSTFSLSTFMSPFKIRSFRILIGIYLFAFLSMDVVSTVYAYYMNYYLKRPAELNYVLGTLLIVQIALVPLVIKMANLLGKAKTVMISTVLWMAGVLVMMLLKPDWPPWAVYAITALMGSGIIGCIVMPWTMYPDVTDVGEFALKRRTSGTFSGIMTFMRTFSSAVGIFIVSQILDFSGYIKPVEKTVDSAVTQVLQQQPDSLIAALKAIIVGFPAVLLVVVFLLARKYPLSAAVHKKLSEHIEYLRGERDKGLPDEEVRDLQDKLV